MIGQRDLRLYHKGMLRFRQFDNGAVATDNAVALQPAYPFLAGASGQVDLLGELLIGNAAIPAQYFKDFFVDSIKPGFLFHR
ncbi:Uncharacterised protein [Serratia plymuthica]|uniref:Uncharacterized protein n=1 Tax=Serratia plymuthica TaxID=82996 RepID=A0A2X4UMX9_SERPL|nr:Uncharacterised protein [Serratia plymuthica]